MNAGISDLSTPALLHRNSIREIFEAEAALERCRAEVFRRDKHRCEAELLCIERNWLQCQVAVEGCIQEVDIQCDSVYPKARRIQGEGRVKAG